MYDLKARDFLLALFAAYLMAETIKGRFQDKTLVLALLALVITLFVLPFLFPHKIADGRLWTMDIHWSAVLGNGLYERAGEVSNFDAFSNYGVLTSWLISISREYPFFETLGGTVTLLKVINLVFCAFVVAIAIQRVGWNNRRMILAAALLLLFLFSGMSSGFAQTFDTPNQLPIRFLTVPVSVFLAYYIAGRKLFAGAAIFGLIAPVLLFYNFETGIYCISALGFALFIENARKGLLNLIITGVVLTLCFSISGVIFIHLAFEGSLLDVIAHLFDIIRLKVESGSSGFAGLSAYLFPPFVIVMIHSSILFAGYLLSVKDRTPLTAVEFQSIVLVGMIIAIGPYVMNRFHILNMWVPFLLYALVVLPKLTVKQRSQQIFWSFALIVLVIPFVFGNPVRRVLSNEFVAAVSDNIHGELTPCLDGLVASDALCQYVTDKANDLETLSQQIPGLQWMSGLSLNILRVTGLSPVLDHKAPFFFAHRDETRDLVLANLRQHEPIAIAIDNIKHGNVAGIPPAVGDFQRRLVRDAGYEIVEETEYWTIARKP
jgi:hypothetical protein